LPAAVQVLNDVRIISDLNMIIVFFISGLVLKTEDLKKAWDHKLGVVYGFLAIIIVTPMLGYLFNVIPLQPQEFALGRQG
jgi:solute carrier family 10 (sodium/bile acid cotransporter), member 7